MTYTPEFKRNLRTLAKKYRHIHTDLQPGIDQLLNGIFTGDQISGTNYTIFKLRVKNSELSKGKSSGYRLIYQLQSPKRIVLLTIYSKLDQGDITSAQIKRIIKEVDN